MLGAGVRDESGRAVDAPSAGMEMMQLPDQSGREVPMIEEDTDPTWRRRFADAGDAMQEDRWNGETFGQVSGIIVEQLINPLKPCDAVALSSASASLWNNRPLVLLEELQQDHNAAAALAAKAGISRSDLHQAFRVNWQRWAQALSTDDMRTLGELSSLLVFLHEARINYEDRAGVVQLAVGLKTAGVAALPRLRILHLQYGTGLSRAQPVCHVLNRPSMGDPGASALAASLLNGAMPKLLELGESPLSIPSSNHLSISRITRDEPPIDRLILGSPLALSVLDGNGIGDAGLMALAPALRNKLPRLQKLSLKNNKIGDQGISSLVNPPLRVVDGALMLPAGDLPAGDLSNLKWLDLSRNHIPDAGCRTLVTAIESNEMPALLQLSMSQTGLPFASGASMRLLEKALQMSIASRPPVMVLDPLTPADFCGFDRLLVCGISAWLCFGVLIILVMIATTWL